MSAYTSLGLDQPLATTAVAVSPDFARDGSVFAAVKGGVLRSGDRGQNWYTTALPTPPPLVSALAISPNFEQDGILLAGTTEAGVFTSTDRGVHWTPWNFGLIDLNVYAVAISPGFARDETVLVGTESGVFRSTNSGRAWRATAFPMEASPVLSLCIVPTAEPDNNLVLAGTEANGLFCSADHGLTWTQLHEDTVAGSVNALITRRQSDASHTIFALVDDNVVASTDGGQTWTTVQELARDATAILAPPSRKGDLLVGLLDGEIVRIPVANGQKITTSDEV